MLTTDTVVTSEDEAKVFRKQKKCFLKCKEAAWGRFHRNYLVVLTERHNLNHKDKFADIQIGGVVIIKGESKNRGHWELAIVEKLHSRKDSVIRAVGLRTGKNYLERPMQLLYQMELHCCTVRNTDTILNPIVEEFRHSRPKRTTAAVTKVKNRDIQPEDDDILSLIKWG